MGWFDILKNDKYDLERVLQGLVEDYGFDKDKDDFESMLMGFNIEGDTAIDVTFEDMSEGNMTEESDIFDEDEGWYRIEFSYKQEEFAMADFTLHSDYQMHEFNPDVIGEDLEIAIKQLRKL